ncbi:MAG: ATP-binding cassette domain-containing protein, partial [Actinomyces sp.]
GPGELVAVVGGDGSGKTTLARVLVGLLPPDTGRAVVPSRAQVAWVPAEGGVFTDLTVAENMAFAARVHRVGRTDRIARLVATAGLDGVTGRLAGHLSGGQRRKLAVVAALVAEPRLLVVDEVTTGLDPLSRREIWRALADTAAAGSSVVVTTTYLDEAVRADRVVVLHEGRVLADAAPSDLVAPGRTIVDAVTDLERAAAGESPPPAEAPAPRRRPAGVSTDVAPLALTRVTRRFGSHTAVADVDLTVGAGEIVALIGANGAGKTTLMRVALGLLAPSAGRVAVFGGPPDRVRRRRVGYVPQHLGLYRDLTAAENVAFWAGVHGAPAPVDPPGGDELTGRLPLGVQRRLAFAAATAHEPDLLILDEPTSGVSTLERTHLWDLVTARAAAGAGVLVSTHDLLEAEQAPRVVLLAAGHVVAAGPTAEVIAAHGSLEQALLTAAGAPPCPP